MSTFGISALAMACALSMSLNVGTAGAQSSAAAPPFSLITLDPGHFHASLVQKFMYGDVDSVVHVFAPAGDDAAQHLMRIDAFNKRSDNPTHWVERVYTGADFFDRMLATKPGNVVVIAGNNARKMEYIQRSIDAGLNVLADKPMVRTPADLVKLEATFKAAQSKHVLLYDIMTERSEVTTQLQRELSMNRELFGTLLKGTPENPAISEVSVHYFSKIVAGSPLKRPEWFFDVQQEGEGIVDVTTHLVDLVQWEGFPNQSVARSDVTMTRARRWPTPLTLAQFSQLTGASAFPDYLQRDVKNGSLQVLSNGEMTYRIKGVNAHVSVTWNFEAPDGTGDTHFSVMRGSKSSLIIRQGAAQDFKPALYIERNPSVPKARHDRAVLTALMSLQERFSGVGVRREGDVWAVTIPDSFDVGHEAHFAEVTNRFLGYLRGEAMPAWEVPNMLTKYATIMKAYTMSGGR
jgi:predicted dehydrogenase